MHLHKKSDPYLFLLLPLLAYVSIVIIPIFTTLYYSLQDWNGLFPMEYTGFTNYVKLFHDSTLRQVLGNTAIFAALATCMQIGVGLLYSMLLVSIPKGRNVIRVLLFCPTIISSMAVSQTFKKLLDVDPDGVLNVLLTSVGLPRVAFLSDPYITLYVVIFIESYRYLGLYMVVFYAAFVDIDQSVIEASMIDGANRFQTMFKVQLPIIKIVIQNNILLALIGTFKVFEGPYILTNGGPGYASEVISTYMYKTAFSKMNYGYASAISVLIAFFCFTIYFAVKKVLNRKENM